jgi:hypothetical protein
MGVKMCWRLEQFFTMIGSVLSSRGGENDDDIWRYFEVPTSCDPGDGGDDDDDDVAQIRKIIRWPI